MAGYRVTEENLADALKDADYLNEDALGVYLTENGYKPGGGLVGLQCLNGQVAVYNDGDWERKPASRPMESPRSRTI